VEQELQVQPGWREAALAALLLAPLLYLLFVHGAPIPQDQSYHDLADVRTWLGIRNFGNVASNVLFLVVGVAGLLWCQRHAGIGARNSWIVFFLGVALVFFGSAYYHLAPGDDTLVWDRLPMTMAFMGLCAALVAEHLSGKFERPLLIAAVAIGIASVLWWKHSGDLRVYIWVQAAPLLTIPLVIALFPGRYSHRHYLFYCFVIYALAKLAEHNDREIFELTSNAMSGHSLKHLLAAIGVYCVYLMLRRRQSLTPVASSQ